MENKNVYPVHPQTSEPLQTNSAKIKKICEIIIESSQENSIHSKETTEPIDELSLQLSECRIVMHVESPINYLGTIPFAAP